MEKKMNQYENQELTQGGNYDLDILEHLYAAMDDMESLNPLKDDSMEKILSRLEKIKAGNDILSVYQAENISLSEDVLAVFNEFSKNPILSTEELNVHFAAMKQGNVEARQKIYDSNQMLVMLTAKEYIDCEAELDAPFDVQKLGISFEGLRCIGNRGLEKAIDKFDYEKGYDFESYAIWWIYRAYPRAVAEFLNVPIHKMELIRTVCRYVNQFRKEHGYEPTYQEIADEMGIDGEAASIILNQISFLEFKHSIKKYEEPHPPIRELINNVYKNLYEVTAKAPIE